MGPNRKTFNESSGEIYHSNLVMIEGDSIALDFTRIYKILPQPTTPSSPIAQFLVRYGIKLAQIKARVLMHE